MMKVLWLLNARLLLLLLLLLLAALPFNDLQVHGDTSILAPACGTA